MKPKPPAAPTASPPSVRPSDRQKHDAARAQLVELVTSVSPFEARELLRDILPQRKLVQFLGEFLSGEDLLPGLAQWRENYLRTFESFNIEPDIQRLIGLARDLLTDKPGN
jgi:hypothetical protein